MLRIWLWSAKKDTGESMASLDLAQRRTTCEENTIVSKKWIPIVKDNASVRGNAGMLKLSLSDVENLPQVHT